MSNQSKAIVLHSIKYGETSLIVNCFLYDIGVKSFIVKGVLNSKNKKFRKSYFLPSKLTLPQIKILRKIIEVACFLPL